MSAKIVEVRRFAAITDLKECYMKYIKIVLLILSVIAVVCLALISCAKKEEIAEEPSDTESPSKVTELTAPFIEGFSSDGSLRIVYDDFLSIFYGCPLAESFDVTVTKYGAYMPAEGDSGTVIFQQRDSKLLGAKLNDLSPSTFYKISVCGKSGNTVSPTTERYLYVADKILMDGEVERACLEYGIEEGTSAYDALSTLVQRYNEKLIAKASSPLLFFFEGCGIDPSPKTRFGAMCVLIKDCKIVYLNRYCSTVPDYPFNPEYNNGKHMGTVQSGIYDFSTVNHGSANYAALDINGARPVRFSSQESYYQSTGTGFHIHRRYCVGPNPTPNEWVNSAGCFLVGKPSPEDYIDFPKVLGILPSDAQKLTSYTSKVSGTVVVNRDYARDYLSSLGYPQGAIDIIVSDKDEKNVFAENLSSYKIVVPKDADNDTIQAAERICDMLSQRFGITLPIEDDASPVGEYEICVGNTDRDDKTAEENEYLVYSQSARIFINAGSAEGFDEAIKFSQALLNSSSSLLGANYSAVFEATVPAEATT